VVERRHWLVVVDVAPDKVRRKLDRALRDLGFEEVLPCTYMDRWTPPTRALLLRRLRAHLRAGVGKVLVCRLGRTAPFWLGPSGNR